MFPVEGKKLTELMSFYLSDHQSNNKKFCANYLENIKKRKNTWTKFVPKCPKGIESFSGNKEKYPKYSKESQPRRI